MGSSYWDVSTERLTRSAKDLAEVADLQRTLQKQSSPEVFYTEHVFGNFAKCSRKNL